MAITKIHPITATVNKAIEYICNPEKTDDKLLISSFACSPETASIDFKYTLDHCREQGQNKAYHLIQAFAPGEVSFEEAHSVGVELAEKVLLGKYSYVVTTHIDKGHVHNHIIFCAADNIEHNKYNDCKKSYWNIRNLSDDLCKEHNLSVVVSSGKRGQKYFEWQVNKTDNSWKEQLKKDINQTIKASSSYDDFLALMQAKGYEMKNASLDETSGKYISFRPLGKDRFIRGSIKSLGSNFTKERIKERIDNKRNKTSVFLTSTKKIGKIIDTSANPDFIENIGFKKWASKENLKIAAKTYSLMTAQNIHTFSELNEKIAALSAQSKASNQSIIALEHRIKNLSEVLKYAEQYQENKPIHDHYQTAKDKDRYFRKFESNIILYSGAQNMLEQLGFQPNNMNLIKLKSEYQQLVEQKSQLISLNKNTQRECKELEMIQQNMLTYLKDNSLQAVSKIQEPEH